MKNTRYLELLAERFPNRRAAVTEIINLRMIRRLPKGTEYFFSDLHGEHEAFIHMLRSASGNIKVKIDDIFDLSLGDEERTELANVIYYPSMVMNNLELKGAERLEWYKKTIYRLSEVAKEVSKKYTRSKVAKKIPAEYSYVIIELLQSDYSDFDKKKYCAELINAVAEEGDAEHFIVELCELISHLTVDRLHIVGDLFDRGPRADLIIDELKKFSDVDIQYGNHDASWIGAAAGCKALICNTLRIALNYNNFDLLSDGYSINFSPLMSFAQKVYADDPCEFFKIKVFDKSVTGVRDLDVVAKMHKAISVMQFKLEGQIISRHPEYGMDGRKMIERVDLKEGTLDVDGVKYKMRDTNLPTLDPKHPFKLTEGEEEVLDALLNSYRNSARLQEQIDYVVDHGSMYKAVNGNLLFHAAVPMTEAGEFDEFIYGGKPYKGKALMDKVDEVIREAHDGREGTKKHEDALDFMWYLWCGPLSPTFAKHKIATFENFFVGTKELRKENYNPYFKLSQNDPAIADKVMEEFGVDPAHGHIINGHVPVKFKDGENPIKAGGKLFVIDGGIAKSYQEKTGIAGYTLMYNSRHLALAKHTAPVKDIRQQILYENTPEIMIVDVEKARLAVADTDNGDELLEQINDLRKLISAYDKGTIREKY